MFIDFPQLSLQIGSSLYDADGAEIVQKLVDKAKSRNVQLHLPVDFITGDKFAEDAKTATATVSSGIQEGWMVCFFKIFVYCLTLFHISSCFCCSLLIEKDKKVILKCSISILHTYVIYVFTCMYVMKASLLRNVVLSILSSRSKIVKLSKAGEKHNMFRTHRVAVSHFE